MTEQKLSNSLRIRSPFDDIQPVKLQYLKENVFNPTLPVTFMASMP